VEDLLIPLVEVDKNQQVPLMTEIYSKAKKILAWLREAREEDDLETIFKVMNRVGMLYRYNLRHFNEDIPRNFFWKGGRYPLGYSESYQ